MVPSPDNTPESLDGQVTNDGESDRRLEQSVGGRETTGNDPFAESGEEAFAQDWTPPEMLADRYRLEEKIGQGGMGVVYRVHDVELDLKRAVKLISRGTVERFRTEARSIATLNHPSIVRFFEFKQQDELYYILMEHVEGESLSQRLARKGKIPPEEALRITVAICEALAHAHRKGVIHRDIKPSNVLLSDEGIPKVVDFGLARIDSDQGQHTRAGATLGTIDYMSPEQRRDVAGVDHRSDLWSLGATFYEMLTGEPPHPVEMDSIPESIQSTMAKVLKRKPDDRYQAADDFRDALKVALDSLAAHQRSTVSEGRLAEGECPSCGTINDSIRKFCKERECAAPLRVSCLSCEEQIPVWDEVCGDCGGKQEELLEQRRLSMQEQRDEAEVLGRQYQYEKARTLVEQIRSEPDVRLQQLRDWTTGFLESLASEESEQQERIAGLLGQSEQDRASYDYASAVQTLEQIPEPLRTAETSGLLVEMERSKTELAELLATIRERVKNRDLEGLLAQVTRALELHPDRKDLQKINGQLQEREEKKRGQAVSHYNRGKAHYDSGDFGAAITDYTEAIQLNPEYAGAYVNRGFAHCKKGDYRAAIIDYTEAIRLNPEDALAYRNRGYAHGMNGDYREAITDYTEAIRLDPDDALAHYRRGVAYGNSDNHDAAITDLTEAIRLNPEDAGAYRNRGLAYGHNDNHDAALIDFTRAIRLNPEDAESYLNRGIARRKNGQHPAAISDFTEAIRLNPANAEAYHNCGIAHANNGDYGLALADFTEAIWREPENAVTHLNRGLSHGNNDNHAAAISDFTEAIRLNSEYAHAYHNRGIAHARLGNQAKAEADRQKARELGFIP